MAKRLLQHSQQRVHHHLEHLRLNVAGPTALLQLSLLGAVTGLLAGLVILAFRWGIHEGQAAFLGVEHLDDYSVLPWYARIALLLTGATILAWVFSALRAPHRQVGVVHVLERLAYHRSDIPLVNTVVQFFAAILAIICGFSVGREGPGVHLGAAGAALVANPLGLPNNATRTLVACGVAAAIAASFNTPLAGVLFAMEVVMMEYTLLGFAPVIAASVCATALIQVVHGNDVSFSVPAVELVSLAEMPYLILVGIVIGILANRFVWLIARLAQLSREWSFWRKFLLAGLFTGLVAIPLPEVMGLGYGPLNMALAGELTFALAIGICIGKLLTAAAATGLGIPAGIIGPMLVIGASAGYAMGMIVDWLFPGSGSHPAFYAMLGMTAMMCASLQAPLAALAAILELTASPAFILPGMLTMIAALLTTRMMGINDSLFVELMRGRGLTYENDPVSQALRRAGVSQVMNRRFVQVNEQMVVAELQQLQDQGVQWLITGQDSRRHKLFALHQLAQALDELEEERVDLNKLPNLRVDAIALNLRESLMDARSSLQQAQCEAAIVHRRLADGTERIYGVVTLARIESHH